jgi:hypothetical protein
MACDEAGQALAVVALAMSSGVAGAQGAATRVLGDLIAQRLRRYEAGRQAWHDFLADPYDDSLARQLLAQELEQDSGFREQLVRQLARLSGKPLPPGAVKHQACDGSVHRNTTRNRKASGFSVTAIVAAVIGPNG